MPRAPRRPKRCWRSKTTSSFPDAAFVFATRYGEQFLYFEVDGKDPDPPIYHYYGDDDSFRRVYDSIWDFVEDELELTAGSPTWHRAPSPAPAKGKSAKKKK